MQFEGAVVREQGQTFAVVVVKKHVIDNRSEAAEAIGGFAGVIRGMPIVLMAQDTLGRPEFYGRRDIVQFLASVPISAIPWRKYTLN